MSWSKKSLWLMIPNSAEFVSVSTYCSPVFFSVTLPAISDNFRCSQAKVKGPRIFLGPFVRLIAYKYAALHLEAAGYNKFPQQAVHFLVYLGRYQLYALFFLKIGFCLCFVYAFLQFVKAAKLVDIGFRQP